MTFEEVFNSYPEAIKIKYATRFLTLKILIGQCEECKHHNCEVMIVDCCPVEIEKDAVLKTIPKKPIAVENAIVVEEGYGVIVFTEAKCPACGTVMIAGEFEYEDVSSFQYCDCCGQAIDWSDENGI